MLRILDYSEMENKEPARRICSCQEILLVFMLQEGCFAPFLCHFTNYSCGSVFYQHIIDLTIMSYIRH
jgi:hypothetical protein